MKVKNVHRLGQIFSCILMFFLLSGSQAVGLSVPGFAQVALVNKSSDSDFLFDGYFCGAILVSETVVATVDHCVADRSISTLDVVVGVSNLCGSNPRSERRGIVDIGYPSHGNHLALVHLDAPVKAKPATILSDPRETRGNIAVGWGRLTESEAGTCFQKRIPMTVLPVSECASDLSALQVDLTAFSVYTCAIPTDKTGLNSCYGDSGGALLSQTRDEWELDSLTLAGADCMPTSKSVHRKLTSRSVSDKPLESVSIVAQQGHGLP